MVGEIKFNRRRINTELMKRKILQIEERTIRIRVYNGIRILESLGIISKEKKIVIWKGVPATKKGDQKVINMDRVQ